MEFRAGTVLRKLTIVAVGIVMLAVAWAGESGPLSKTGLSSSLSGGGVSPVSDAEFKDLPDEAGRKRVALSFDLDRGEVQFREILRSLESENARATFFVAGSWAALHPAEVKLIAQAGHEVGILGHRQIDLTRLEPGAIRSELRNAKLAVSAAMNRNPRLFRPPLGRSNESVSREATGLGLTPVMWTVDSHDSQGVSAQYISRRLFSRAAPGAVFRLHAGDAARETAGALPDLIRELRLRGYQVVTVSELNDDPPSTRR